SSNSGCWARRSISSSCSWDGAWFTGSNDFCRPPPIATEDSHARAPTGVMTLAAFALISSAVLAAAFVQGTTGVGFALIVAPVVGLLSPDLLPLCLLVLMLPLNLYVAWRERGAIDRSGAQWITGGRFLGTFVGLWV